MRSFKSTAVTVGFLLILVTGIQLTRKDRMNEFGVRIGYGLDKRSIPNLDPAKITSFMQGALLPNLYSGLIEYDLNGNLQSGIATKFYWVGPKLVFEFGSKVKTKAGHFINAADAAASIRRILKLGSS